ncbi:MAG: cytidylate kinase family protein [Victivallales bacterium]|nr:cytidylate kinase family protein [Victivallales bacterium]
MAIITIARERGAYGRIIARKLADALDAHFIDRDIVDARLEGLGVTQKKREAFDERKPGFFASLTNAVEEYVTCLKLVLYEEALQGNCVILGRGGQMLFKDVPGSLSVRLIAPPEIRCQRVAEAEELDIAQARTVVSRVDHNREGFNNFFFDSEWANPLNYDVIFNTGDISPEKVTMLITAMAKAIPQDEIKRGIEKLKSYTLAQKVEREILHVKKIPVFFLNVKCKDGTVVLTGIAHSDEVIEQAKKAAVIDGVKKVVSKLEIGMHAHFDGRM